LLQAENLSASYRDDVPVFTRVSFSLDEGEFLGIIGPNGSGKTTLLKVITGVKKPVHGRVLLKGKDIREYRRREVARVMAVVPQSSFLPPLFTVEDTVLLGRYPHARGGFGTGETREDLRIAEDAMRETGTLHLRDRFVGELSGGERQEVLIARALAQEPRILVLDEPTANLDVKHQLRILDLVKNLVERRKLTAVMVIHDLNLAARFCTRLILLHGGGIRCHGTPEEVLTPARLKQAYEVDVRVERPAGTDALTIIILKRETAPIRNGGAS